MGLNETDEFRAATTASVQKLIRQAMPGGAQVPKHVQLLMELAFAQGAIYGLLQARDSMTVKP